jgi:hypothetical protein
MCIRALDYCPPVDVTFGDYLRALVTADRDLVPDDDRGYRIAVIEGFRRRGIFPQGVRSLSSESLCWGVPAGLEKTELMKLLPGVEGLHQLRPDWSLSTDRRQAWNDMKENGRAIHDWLLSDAGRSLGAAVGLSLGPDAPFSIERKNGLPKFEVHSVRPARRLGPDGQTLTDLVIEITQKRRGYFDPETQEAVDTKADDSPPTEDFWIRGGCTVLIDFDKGGVRYCVGKRITSKVRLKAQRDFLLGVADGSLRATYFGDPRRREESEPFALMHRSVGEEVP